MTTNNTSGLCPGVVYSGKNINGLDSIQEIFVVVKDDFYKGTVRIRSSYTKERAQVAFYTLNGRMLESGDLYIPTEAYSMLQKYVLNTFVLMGFEEGPIYYTRTMVPGSETYRWEYGYNPNAYNCHQYVWGDPDPGSPFMTPCFPIGITSQLLGDIEKCHQVKPHK